MSIIRLERAEADYDRLTNKTIALVKGMLKRGDKQSDIAACFLINSGRVAEINHGKRGADIEYAMPTELPPAGPYPSPYELWLQGQQIWRARVALEKAELALHEAIIAVRKVEQ